MILAKALAKIRGRGNLTDLSSADREILQFAKPFTMTSTERLYAVVNAVRYVVRYKIPGDIVECGVWKGGSMMAAAKTLLSLRDTTRQLYLFDTFEGMPEPGSVDTKASTGELAADLLATAPDKKAVLAYSSLDEVRRNLARTGYPNLKFVKGMVENTIPHEAPSSISILRLDTDWYKSTRHELMHLYDRLSIGGVLIIDDYGHWEGCRKAVDEFFSERNVPVLLNRIDYTGRIAVKMA